MRNFANKKMRALYIFILAAFCGGKAVAQGYISTEYVNESGMKSHDDDRQGRGDITLIKGRYTIPLSVKRDGVGEVRAWTATVSAAYGMMNGEEEATEVNPKRLLNTSVNVAHTRPLSRRWRLIASLGAGVYAEPSDISMRSVLANAAVIFAYKVNNDLSIGVGGGLTNSYGAPIMLPMGYLKWNTKGRMRVDVDMIGGMKAKVSTNLSQRLSLSLTAIDMDGVSAVVRHNGQWKIYSQTMMRSYLTAAYAISKRSAAYFSVGGCWMRTIRLTDRSLKSFFNSFGSDEGKHRFAPTVYLALGIRVM